MSLFRVLVQVIMAISTVSSAFLCCFSVAWKHRYALEASSRECQYAEKNKQALMSSPFQSDNSWNVTWHTLLEYYPTASLVAIGWVLAFSFHGLVHERECASCHTSGNPKINVASGSQPSSPLDWKWDLFPSQLSPWPILDSLMDRMTAVQLIFRSSLNTRYQKGQSPETSSGIFRKIAGKATNSKHPPVTLEPVM